MKTKSRYTLFYARNRRRLVKAINLYEAEMLKGQFDSKVFSKEKAMAAKILEGTDLAICGHNLALYGSKINNKNPYIDRPVTNEEFNKLSTQEKLSFHKLVSFPFEVVDMPDWWRQELD